MAVDFDHISCIVKRYALALSGDHQIAEDLAQETMLRAIRHQEMLSQLDEPRKWLLTVVTNLWRDWLRMKKRRPQRQSLNLRLTADSNDPRKICELVEQLKEVLASFEDLPPMQRQVLYLRTVEAFSIAEVSEILNISRASVKTNLSMARRAMRNKHLKHLSEEPT